MIRTLAIRAVLALLVLHTSGALLAAGPGSKSGEATSWPTKGWQKGTPASAGLDEKVLESFDADLARGKYQLVDSFQVFRCGREVFSRKYNHDYAQVYGREAKTKGPLNARLTGRYNYFDPIWHPYYHGTDLHTMQSVSKTVTSAIYGVAITRGDFKAGLNTPVLKYFDIAKVKNVDDRKRRMTLKDVLTMTTGLQWNEEVPYDDPRSDSSMMEATDDWVQYVIDKPMAEEPGKVFNYSSGATELLAYIFHKETGQDIDAYGQKYLFAPLGIQHHWKRTYLGVVDTEGGLYLNGEDLAKIGYLYLNDGVWEGKRIVSEDWVKKSLTPYIKAEGNFQYGFKWWLYPLNGKFVWMAQGFGGQRLMVFPEEKLIAVFTGWEILKDPAPTKDLVDRLLPAVKQPLMSAMSSANPIRHISDTALWVAVYRARESERPDALFHDPYARQLAGERGTEIAATMPFAERHSWSYVARTWVVDQVIEREVSQGTDMVINLAAGLDARPYRMRLPASLRWVEVDLPDMLNYKQGVLAAESPHCALERIALDLRDRASRRGLFQRLGSEAKRALLLSEGLIIYLLGEDVAELARDLAAPPSFRRWATDLASPALLKMLQKAIGGPLDQAGSPLKFAPREGPQFFARCGWKLVEVRSLLHTAAKLKRLSFGMRLLSLLPDPAGRKPDKPWGGVCLFENSSQHSALSIQPSSR